MTSELYVDAEFPKQPLARSGSVCAWIASSWQVAERSFECVVGHLRRIPRQVCPQRFAYNKCAVLISSLLVGSVPLTATTLRTAIPFRNYLVALAKWVGFVARHHAVVWQWEALLAIPSCSVSMRVLNGDNLQHRSQSPMAIAKTIVALLEHVSDHITFTKPRCKLALATQARDRWILMLKVWLASYRTIDERLKRMLECGFTTFFGKYQGTVSVQVKAGHSSTLSYVRYASDLRKSNGINLTIVTPECTSQSNPKIRFRIVLSML